MKLQPQYQFLVFFRVATGLLLMVHFLAFYTDINRLYGPHSILPSDFCNLFVPQGLITNYRLWTYLEIDPTIYQQGFNVLYLLTAAFLTVGFLTRFSALGMIILHIALIKNNTFFNYGVDHFTSIALWYLFFFPSGVRYSLDYRLFPGWIDRFHNPSNLRLYRIGLQIQVALVYGFSGFDKMLGFNWWNGESIWKALTLPYANLDFNLNFDWLAAYPAIPLILGLGVVMLELLYPLIFIKPLRKPILYGIILMHIGIAISINLYFFSTIMIILNLAAFFDFETLSKQSSSDQQVSVKLSY